MKIKSNSIWRKESSLIQKKSSLIQKKSNLIQKESDLIQKKNGLIQKNNFMPKKSDLKWKKNIKAGRRGNAAWMFLAPSLLGVSIFVLLPFLDAVRRSFTDSRGKQFLGFSVYREITENSAFRLAVANTLRFMAVALPLLMLISFVLSLLVYHYNRNSSFFKTALVLPMAVPAASIVLLWRMVFCDEGIVNQIFQLQTDWIYGNQSFAVLVFAYLWKNTGYQMLLWLAALAGIPDSLYEAAKVDGAGALKQLWYITIPQVRGAAGMILFLAIVNSFKVFREAYVVAGSYPNDNIYMMQHLFNHWFLNLDVQKMSGGAVLMTIAIATPVIILSAKKEEEA